MGDSQGLAAKMQGIQQECDWINGEIYYLNHKVENFKGRITNLEADIHRLQDLQDSMLLEGATPSDRLWGMIRQRRKSLVEIQYALVTSYDELQQLESVLSSLQEEASQLSISLIFNSMSIGSA